MPAAVKLPDSESVTYLIDASIYIFRAWFGIPDQFFDSQGRPMNAVYGYLRFLLRFLKQAAPVQVVVAFDESLSCGFRHRLYPPYKANRALPDADLAFQLQTCKDITEMLGIPHAVSEVYEADDLLASLARKRRQKQNQVVVLSTDKDLAQIITPVDAMWDFHNQRLHSYQDLCCQWGFPVDRIAAYLALVGDSVDNIPGISGIGAKTGATLFAHYQGLDDLYDRFDEIDNLGLRGLSRIKSQLLAQEEDARLFYQLTLLRDNVKCRWSDKAVKLRKLDHQALLTWWRGSGLTQAVKLESFLSGYE